MHSQSLHCRALVARAALGARLVSVAATLTGGTPSRTLPGALPAPSMVESTPALRFMQLTCSVLRLGALPGTYSVLRLGALPGTCSVLRLGALPGIRQQHEGFDVITTSKTSTRFAQLVRLQASIYPPPLALINQYSVTEQI